MKRSLVMLLAILLFVTPPVYANNLIDYTLTSDHETVPCVRDLPAPRDTFDAQEHKEFYAIVVLDTVSVGDTLQFEWFFEGDHTVQVKNMCLPRHPGIESVKERVSKYPVLKERI